MGDTVRRTVSRPRTDNVPGPRRAPDDRATLFGVDPDDLPDGLVVADADGRVVCFNAAAARITGTRSADMLGRPIDEALPLEDFEGRRWWACTDPYGGLRTRTRQPERGLLLPGGREVLVTATFVRDPAAGGALTRLVVGLRDTAPRRRAERDSADLVATVAHELRSPLTSVKGFTATLLKKWERFTDEQKKLMLETVDADADRVTRLITELLDISRIDSGRVQLNREIVDVEAAVLRHVEAMVTAGQPEDRFALVLEDALPELWTDRDKLHQVLGNLLENAVRHGAGTVTITLRPVELDKDQGVEVAVVDEGPGIPDELLGLVFTRFWRGTRRRGGTGLGLYIAKGLVEAQGGGIDVGRAPGGGARFRFTLPVAMPDVLA